VTFEGARLGIYPCWRFAAGAVFRGIARILRPQVSSPGFLGRRAKSRQMSLPFQFSAKKRRKTDMTSDQSLDFEVGATKLIPLR